MHCEALALTSHCKASVLQRQAAALYCKASCLGWQDHDFSCIVGFVFFEGSRNSSTAHHSVHFVTHQSFAFYQRLP